ncbi:MAG: gas vesicle protein GvpG [Acidobacteriia bacterium]|nr:gas vesicle protein GvpG [Terriglobia bacterium]
MLVVDDIVLFPVHGILWVLKEIHNAAMEEIASEAQFAATELSELYMALEAGGITEEEFSAREKVLLDRLEAAQSSGRGGEEESGDEDPSPVA